MNEFPIEELYRRIAKIDALRNNTNCIIKHGAGFFYWYDDMVYFATKRSHIIVEEKAFLPDSLVLYPNIEARAAKLGGIALQLYDENEKPSWRLLPTQTLEQYVSIPIKDRTEGLDFTNYFRSPVKFPTSVLLPLNEFTLQMPVAICVSLANYFFYSNEDDEYKFRKEVESGEKFSIHRRGFAFDMLEMVLLLIEKNMSLIKISETKHEFEELSNYIHIHQNLISELDKIMTQFNDVLEPTMFEWVQKIFSIVKNENFMQDYFAVNYLINRILSQLGNNIIYFQ